MMFTERWKNKLEGLADAFWGLNRRIEAIEYGKPDYRVTLRIDEEAKRTTELEERISLLEVAVFRLLSYAATGSTGSLTPENANKILAVMEMCRKDKTFAGASEARTEYREVQRIIESAYGK